MFLMTKYLKEDAVQRMALRDFEGFFQIVVT